MDSKIDIIENLKFEKEKFENRNNVLKLLVEKLERDKINIENEKNELKKHLTE